MVCICGSLGLLGSLPEGMIYQWFAVDVYYGFWNIHSKVVLINFAIASDVKKDGTITGVIWFLF